MRASEPASIRTSDPAPAACYHAAPTTRPAVHRPFVLIHNASWLRSCGSVLGQDSCMTRTRVAPEPEGADKARTDHVNEIVLVGELASVAESRTLPSGDEVVTFRLTVRGPAAVPTTGVRPESRPSRPRSDSLDCIARRPALRARMLRSNVGDVVRVEGALRHRYWRGPGGTNSRYEVEAERVATVRRRRTPSAEAAG